MKHAIPLSVAAALCLLSFVLPGGELRFAVEEKTKLAKVFDAQVSYHSTSIQLRVDGEDVESPMSGMTVHTEQTSHVELSDVYGALKGGKPKKLERTFDKLSGKTAQRYDLPEELKDKGPADTSKDLASGLEGKTVVFTLDDEGEYKPEFGGEKGDAELLKGLEEDMDLRGLLPSGAVEVDKSWEIEAQAFHNVLNLPGGELKMKAEGDKEPNAKLNAELQENVKGKAKGTFKGQREVDGKKYALVALEAELETHGERDDSASAPGAGETELKIAYSVEGELLWDTEGGHLKSCKLTSKLTFTMKSKRKVQQGGESHDLERTTEFEGENEFKAALKD